MTNYLIKLFVKGYKDVHNPKVRERYGKFAGMVGIISNFLLFLIKISVGLLFDSISVIADAVNNLSDSGSSFIMLFSFKLSGKPADARHPYGHGRMEYISGLIVSISIILLGFRLTQSSFEKIIHPGTSKFSGLALSILAASILIKLWQYLFYRKISRTIHSIALLTTSVDSRNDIIATSAVLAGMIISRFSGFNLDGYMGMLVAVFIIISGAKLIQDTISPLLGTPPSKEFVENISRKVLNYDNIIGIHDLVVHNYGPSECFVTLHCEVPAEQDIMLSHDIIDNIECDFLNEQGIHMVIHLDPVVTGDERTNELKAQVERQIEQISASISMHDFRVVWGITHTNLIFDVEVPFGFKYDDEELIAMISGHIAEISRTYHCKITVDHNSVTE